MSTLGAGDNMVRLALPDKAGTLFHFADQAHSGQPVVLCLREAPAETLTDDMARRVADFSAVEAALFGVIQGGQDGGLAAGSEASPRILFDPERRLATAFGFSDAGVIVLDADLRVATCYAGADPGPALAMCQRIFARTTPDTLRAQAPVHLVHDFLEPDLCRRLIDYWKAGEKKSDVVALSSAEKSRTLPDLKKRADVRVSDPDLKTALQERLARRLAPEVFKVFNYKMSFFESLRVGCYDSETGGYFRRHRDNMTPQTAGRRFAVSINLNTGDYEGGQVRFPEYSRALYDPEVGSALVFSCSLLHEALPVTAGRRFAVFTFAFEPPAQGQPTQGQSGQGQPGQAQRA
jgi:hypothetical protein